MKSAKSLRKRSDSVTQLYVKPKAIQRAAPILGSLVISTTIVGCADGTPELYSSVQECSKFHSFGSCQYSYNRAIVAASAHRKKYPLYIPSGFFRP